VDDCILGEGVVVLVVLEEEEGERYMDWLVSCDALCRSVRGDKGGGGGGEDDRLLPVENESILSE
jgi:hypothetical protein